MCLNIWRFYSLQRPHDMRWASSPVLLGLGSVHNRVLEIRDVDAFGRLDHHHGLLGIVGVLEVGAPSELLLSFSLLIEHFALDEGAVLVAAIQLGKEVCLHML
jgi:hypothetical protein